MVEGQELDATLKAEYKGICLQYAMIWGAGTEEQKQTWQAGAATLKSLFEEKKDEMIAETAQAFAENSTDGLASEAQFIAFTQKMEQLHAARGVVMPSKSEALLKPAYANLNKWTAGVEGISMADIWR